MSDHPTRIGLLSDIHGNAIALEAVLEEMDDVDALVCAGDVVGYGPSPGQCIEIVRGQSIPTVEGNHDRAVVTDQPYETGDQYASRTLSEGQRSWLAALPRERLLFDGRLKVVHDHPEERNRYTRPAAFEPTLLDDEDVLVLGHTHVQYAEVFADGIVVNPGSVGQPRDRDPDAAYAVVDLDAMAVDLHRVSYDIEAVRRRIENTSIDSYNAERLARGR
ncbi:metallophosphoesterase family protein [Halapricum desulfuricans]|uniref:Phosphoesterase n=1 Tax=Halapricum desulfuricans TaxID=2841257 RepID=A0A897NGH0_9EURY|nr:metallophosphoesterase family protein [Halapricum desulfuricans]QSG08581.1 Serine/threonine protein phosphatase PP2A family [Halapricum desulfuricans]QSG11534.1 Serine/threonine protein phosphatase PP2A family [Halapricum desulfuricans]